MTIALIEDESEKAEALLAALIDFGLSEEDICNFTNVREAVLAVNENDFRLIVLDVSLPTYSPEGMAGSAGRAQQQSGGVEILRTLKYKNLNSNVIIVTQYPDVLFEGKSIELASVPAYVKEHYNQVVLDAILYREANPEGWKQNLRKAINSLGDKDACTNHRG